MGIVMKSGASIKAGLPPSKKLLDSCSIALPQNSCDVLGLAIIKKQRDIKVISFHAQ